MNTNESTNKIDFDSILILCEIPHPLEPRHFPK